MTNPVFQRTMHYMTAAICEAKKAFLLGEIPVGAVIVEKNQIIARAYNMMRQTANFMRHAEIIAMERALIAKKSKDLTGCELYVTLEPCAMCAGAIAQSGLDHLYIGATDEKAGAVISVKRILNINAGEKKVHYDYLIEEQACQNLLTQFFSNLRKRMCLDNRTEVYPLHPIAFDNDPVFAARALLGCYLVRRCNERLMVVKIVETEAYAGENDKGSHAYKNRITERNRVMFGPYGHAYIYMIYGMYYCLNVVTGPQKTAGAVLIRGAEPIQGLDDMALHRFSKSYAHLTSSQKASLTNGPGKLCMALNLDKSQNGLSLDSPSLYFMQQKELPCFDVVESSRINIGYAKEAQHYPWRFYVKDNPYISK